MPLTYTIDRSLKIVIARASGVLSEEDLRGSREQIQSDPAYHPSFAQLFDLSDVTDIEVSIPVMARIAGSSAVAPNARQAFVGVNDIQYEMARTFATLRRSSLPDEKAIFARRSMRTARRCPRSPRMRPACSATPAIRRIPTRFAG